MDNFSIYAVFDRPKLGLYGNTAAIVLTDTLPGKQQMQQIAADLNQPATTFVCPTGELNTYQVRWFAPDAEIDLCGHGTLAAIVHLGRENNLPVHLLANKHRLTGVMKSSSKAEMQIEGIPAMGETVPPDGLAEALGIQIKGYYPTSNKDIVVLENESDIISMQPDFSALRRIKVFGYAVTATGNTADFVSRTLVPHVQQLEDHATGSSHAALAPFWAERLDKNDLIAIQHSRRGGYFKCTVKDNYVTLGGHFSLIAQGELKPIEVMNP